jgi:hypothetical protein
MFRENAEKILNFVRKLNNVIPEINDPALAYGNEKILDISKMSWCSCYTCCAMWMGGGGRKLCASLQGAPMTFLTAIPLAGLFILPCLHTSVQSVRKLTSSELHVRHSSGNSSCK